MKVRCIATQPTEEQARQLGQDHWPGRGYAGNVGEEYTVLGLWTRRGVVWIDSDVTQEG